MLKYSYALLIRTKFNFNHYHIRNNFLKVSFTTTLKRSVTAGSFIVSHSHNTPKLIMAANRYCIELAKRGTAGCKKCKQKIEKGLVRIGKVVPNPFSDAGGDMKQWFHVRCMFEQLSRARATTKKIEEPDDLEGWEELDSEFRGEVLDCLSEFSSSSSGKKTPQKPAKKATTKASTESSSSSTEKKTLKLSADSPKKASSSNGSNTSGEKSSSGKDDSFREFRRLCASISDESSYTGKTAIVSKFFEKGTDGKGFKGDIYLWVKMLLPGVNKRIFNLQSKQLVKLFSQIFDASQEEMLEDLEQGDVAETVRVFFESSEACPPVKKATLSLQEVDNYLEQLTKVTKEEEQMHALKKVTKRCTGNDLKIFIRLVKHDLRINTGPKHILEALHPTAYQAFQASRNLEDVIRRSLAQKEDGNSGGLTAQASLMTPILPMLAEVCRSVEQAFKKCPNGLLVEIKYDGERVQVHKKGNEFSYFSRSLKPVMAHKVAHLKDFIPKAFPHGNNLILDSEILLVDNDGKPLPFGTLGKHKKTAFQDASVCLFVFDCLQYNGENLIDKPLTQRRKILQENMTPIKNHIMFSEMKRIRDPDELKEMIKSVIDQGLEGLIIKDKESIYEPGKRHWLKVKKDYLEKGAMADSADLVVLGAYYGTGNKGGMMSIFLMGCLNKKSGKWCTVTKVHGGHDDATLDRLQDELDMIKISKDSSKIPSWLNVNKSLIPDFVSANPTKSQVWEITGAEFTKTETHTAGGISIRFPRVTRIRDDKTADEATTVTQLQKLYKTSKETTDMIGLKVAPKQVSKQVPEEEEDDDDENFSDYDYDTDVDKDNVKTEKQIRPQSPSTSKSKRKNNSSSTESPVKKLKQEETSPTKDKHADTSNITQLTSACVLPDVFTGVKLFLSSSIKDVETLRRYFIAYDGELLKDHERGAADYVVSPKLLSKDVCPIRIRQVTPDWLWDCIKLQNRLPTDLYKPIETS